MHATAVSISASSVGLKCCVALPVVNREPQLLEHQRRDGASERHSWPTDSSALQPSPAQDFSGSPALPRTSVAAQPCPAHSHDLCMYLYILSNLECQDRRGAGAVDKQ